MRAKTLTIEKINTTKNLGVAIARIRKLQGMSQSSLANMMNMRQSTVSDIENGKGTLESLIKIIQGLKINLSISNAPSKRKTKARGLLGLLEED